MIKGRKIVTLVIALIAAGLLWLYVVSTVSPEVTSRVSYIPVSIDGSIVLEEQGLMITNQATKTITLELKTSRQNLSKLNASSVRISADASKVREPGTYDLSYKIEFPDTVNSNDVDIIRKSNNRVTVTVAKKETKTVPVTVHWSSDSALDGYSAETDTAIIKPEEIILEGPDYEVSRITEARIDFDFSGLAQTLYEETVPVSFLDENGSVVNLSELTTVSAKEASLTLQILRTKQVELSVELVPGGGVQKENATAVINPPFVTVKGGKDVIDQMEDVVAVGSPIDLSKIHDEENEEDVFAFTLALPAGVTDKAGERTVSVEVRVLLDGVTTANLALVDNLQGEGLPEDLAWSLEKRPVNVTVRGSVEEIAAIKENLNREVQLVFDFSSVTEPGSLEITNDNGYCSIISENHPALYFQLAEPITVRIEQAQDPVDQE